jgi:predicted restriction endonuclease
MIKSSALERVAPPIEYELSSERWHGDSPLGNLNPGRKDVVGSRVVRSVEVANSVKRLYDHSCQICGNRLDVSGRGYSEGAHIQALSGGHGGPDVVENVLCLCPNCHVQFDYGSIVIQDDYSLTRNGKPAGKLHKKASHDIDKKYLTYHRERYGE